MLSTNTKIRMAIDLAIYLGMFETDSVSAIRRLLNPGSVVLDIGANIGAHTLPMARRVGPNGKVYAFEPTQTSRYMDLLFLHDRTARSVCTQSAA